MFRTLFVRPLCKCYSFPLQRPRSIQSGAHRQRRSLLKHQLRPLASVATLAFPASNHPVPVASEFLGRIIQGVGAATKLSNELVDPIVENLSDRGGRGSLVSDWLHEIDVAFSLNDDSSRQVAKLGLAISFLVQKSRTSGAEGNTSPQELQTAWSLIRNALDSPLIRSSYQNANRSAQGFLAVPLCSLVSGEGNIDILFRLHVWLPDGHRGASGFGIHSHQPFAQSWILAGSARDLAFDVSACGSIDEASHAKYALTWTSGGSAELTNTYKTHQVFSKIVNTGQYVRANLRRTAEHSRNMSYAIPSAAFHSSEVAPDIVHATLFLFDASRGFVRDAGVLGPRDAKSSVQVREAAGVTPSGLACLVEAIRDWEDHIERAHLSMQRGEWHQAFSALNKAQKLCDERLDVRGTAIYKSEVVKGFKSLLSQVQGVDAADIAKWHYFYGRALLAGNQEAEALAHINHVDDIPPVIAFAREPSEYNRQQLRHLCDLGADFDRLDAHGSSALDYAIMNNDYGSENIILEALRKKRMTELASALHLQTRQARLRKNLVELFRQTLRPLLLEGSPKVLEAIRHAYSESLQQHQAKARAFDRLRYVRYEDLKTLGRFPQFSEGLTSTYNPEVATVKHIIFVSYRWANRDPWARESDTADHVQYNRAVHAIELFLAWHPNLRASELGIWIDYSCIDRQAPEPGISALPMILAQCETMISIVEAQYYTRAWCNLEVMFFQALRKAYGLHQWFEYRVHGSSDGELGPGPENPDVEVKNKFLRFEDDRPKILFLEKQCGILR